MILTEVHQDLFTVPKDYALVHCISADYALGAGIAKEFAKRGVKEVLKDSYKTPVGKTAPTHATDWVMEFNLVTKEKYYYKPTYDTLHSALVHMKLYCNLWKIKKLAMPRIGCGLDRLQWDKVKQIIEEVFFDTDVEILVCSI